MATAFAEILIISGRCIPYFVAQLLALNEHTSEKHSFGCVPTDIQLLERGALRMLVIVDEIDAWWVFKTKLLRKYSAKRHGGHVLWSCTIPAMSHETTFERILHLAAFITTLANHLALGCTDRKWWRRSIPRRIAEVNQIIKNPRRLTGWITPLTMDERTNMLEYTEQLKAGLLSMFPNPPVHSHSGPPPIQETCDATEFSVCVPGRIRYLQSSNIVTNLEDQANLWRVAYLGGWQSFSPPDPVWLTGSSPVEAVHW